MDEAKTTSNLLAKKVDKIVHSGIDHDKDFLTALQSLGSFYSDNTLNKRRSLRSLIENRNLSINEDFFRSFVEIKKSVDALHEQISEMNGLSEEIKSDLQETKQQYTRIFKEPS